MQKMEIESFQLPHLLRYVDRNSMRHSIEARVPFLDHHLVETCYGISSKLKIKDGWTKHILRVAMQGLVSQQYPVAKKQIRVRSADRIVDQ